MNLKTSDGTVHLIFFTRLHRHHRRGVYRPVTDWLAQTGTVTAWAPTRREALIRLMEMTGGVRT